MAQETSVSIWSGKKVELEMQPVVVAGIEFDALIQADMQMTSTLPQYTVEKGYVITDNIVLKPETMNLTLFLTDTPVTWYERQGHGAGHTLETIDKLRDLYYKRQLFSVITREAEYEDMFVTSISIQKSKEIGYSRQVTMALQQVRVTEAKTVEIPETYGKALPELTGSSDVNDTVETLGTSEEPSSSSEYSNDPLSKADRNTVGAGATPQVTKTSSVPADANYSKTNLGDNLSADVGQYCVAYKEKGKNWKYCVCFCNDSAWYRLNRIGWYHTSVKIGNDIKTYRADTKTNYGADSGVWTDANKFYSFCAKGKTFDDTNVTDHFHHAYQVTSFSVLSYSDTKLYDIYGHVTTNSSQGKTLCTKILDKGKFTNPDKSEYEYFGWGELSDVAKYGASGIKHYPIQPIAPTYETKFRLVTAQYIKGKDRKMVYFFGTVNTDKATTDNFVTLTGMSPQESAVKAVKAWAVSSNRGTAKIDKSKKCGEFVYASSISVFKLSNPITFAQLKNYYNDRGMTQQAKTNFKKYVLDKHPELKSAWG